MYMRTGHELRCVPHTAHLTDVAPIANRGASSLPGTHLNSCLLLTKRSGVYRQSTTTTESTDCGIVERGSQSMTWLSGVGMYQPATAPMVLGCALDPLMSW